MAKLKNAARPEGQSKEYTFLTNEPTGRGWKAKTQWVDARSPQMEQTEEGAQLHADHISAIVSVAPHGPDGKALVGSDGHPIVHYHTHTFNRMELAQPNFDPEVELARILHRVVEQGETVMASESKLEALKT